MPTQLPFTPGTNGTAEGSGQQLRTQTDPQHRHTSQDALRHKQLLGSQERQLTSVSQSHGTTQHDNAGVVSWLRGHRVASIRAEHRNLVARSRKGGSNPTRSFLIHVLQHKHGHSGSSVSQPAVTAGVIPMRCKCS